MPEKPVCLGLYMFFAGAAVELLQLIHLDRLLHADGTLLGVILGSTFDIIDLFCYGGGRCAFFPCRAFVRRNLRKPQGALTFGKAFTEKRQTKKAVLTFRRRRFRHKTG